MPDVEQDEPFNGDKSNISDLQLVFTEGQKQYAEYRPLLGKEVVVMGTLFGAQTGHHHTDLLITVKKIKRR